jgi:hypothetical protein
VWGKRSRLRTSITDPQCLEAKNVMKLILVPVPGPVLGDPVLLLEVSYPTSQKCRRKRRPSTDPVCASLVGFCKALER